MKKYLLLIMLAVFSLFSLRGNAYGFGLVNHGNERPNAGKYGDIINNNGGVYIGKDTKEIYLTFDCGYENGYTPMILDALKNTDTKAIFFITGHYLTSATDLVQRMMDEGHIIGNHTYAHKDFTKSSNESILEDIKKLENKFYETFGKKCLPMFVHQEVSLMKEASSYYRIMGINPCFGPWLMWIGIRISLMEISTAISRL